MKIFNFMRCPYQKLYTYILQILYHNIPDPLLGTATVLSCPFNVIAYFTMLLLSQNI